MNGLEYFEFKFFRRYRRISQNGLSRLSLFSGLSRCRLIGRCRAALRFRIACFVRSRWQPADVVFYFRTRDIVLPYSLLRQPRRLLGGSWDMRLFSRNPFLLWNCLFDGLCGWLRLGPN